MGRLLFAGGPLNAALAAKSLESQVNAERAAFSKGADLPIVAPPRHANLQAVVFILDAEPGPDRFKSVSQRERVLLDLRYGLSVLLSPGMQWQIYSYKLRTIEAQYLGPERKEAFSDKHSGAR